MANEVKIQWHPAFGQAMRLTFEEDYDALYFDDEYVLNSGPLKADLLIIHKEIDAPVKNAIGKIFKKHNIFEYKSPADELSIDTFYKVMAYGCLYKRKVREGVNSVSPNEITLSLLREGKPKKLLEELGKCGVEVTSNYPGIYYLSGRIMFDTQIIVARELPGKEYKWLQALTKNLKEDKAGELVMEAATFEPGDWKAIAADSVMQVAMSANLGTFEKLKKEDPVMCDALKELMKPEIEEELKNENKKSRQDEKKQIAKNMLNDGDSISKVARNTELSEKTVREIATDLGLVTA